MKYSFIKDAELIPLSQIGMNICYSPVKFERGEVIEGKRKGGIVMFIKNNKMFAVDDSLGILFDMQKELKSNAIGRGGAMRGGGFPIRGGGFPMRGVGFPIRGGGRGGFPLGLARRGFPSRRGHYRNGKFYVPQGFSVYNTLGGMCYYLDENGFPVYFPCNSWVYDLDVSNIP
jgi:hypothetical protein